MGSITLAPRSTVRQLSIFLLLYLRLLLGTTLVGLSLQGTETLRLLLLSPRVQQMKQIYISITGLLAELTMLIMFKTQLQL